MFGGGGSGGAPELPRIVQLGLSRPTRSLPRRGRPLPFLVSVHEEASAVTFAADVSLSPMDEEALIGLVDELGLWSQGLALTPSTARSAVDEVSRLLVGLVFTDEVAAYLDQLRPSALLLGVDETLLNLPWELLGAQQHEWALDIPLGRVVSTRVRPAPRRDPIEEDRTVRILVIENPSEDLSATEAEVAAIEELAGPMGPATIEVVVLRGAEATGDGVREAVRDGTFDIVHFAGHGRFDDRRPGTSALVLVDGELRADDVLDLPWAKPPYLVYNAACESARGARGRRLVSAERRSAGLPAAFLATGVQGYLGHFFPVEETAAAEISRTFYPALFGLRNVGLAVSEARRSVRSRFDDRVDLASFGLTYFGDSGGAQRADLHTAA